MKTSFDISGIDVKDSYNLHCKQNIFEDDEAIRIIKILIDKGFTYEDIITAYYDIKGYKQI